MRMTKRTLLKALGLTAILPLAGCGDYTWNQKITVTVQTPQGEKSGSAVTTLVSRWPMFRSDMNNPSQGLQGEATVVDLGQGKYLFALLDEKAKNLALVAFEKELPKQTEDAWGALASQTGRKAVITSSSHAPMLVAFKNLNDPASVVEVNSSNLEGTFGSGYSLKSITLEITDEKVTEGVVRKLLPWIREYDNKLFDGDTVMRSSAANRLANSLGSGNFEAGEKK